MARLERAYSTLFGAESTKGQLYTGFYLLLGGVFAVLAAVVVFVISNQQTGDAYWTWREAAFLIAALAGPAVFLGISVALPSKMGMRVVQGIGGLMCLAATILFSVHYPGNFNVADSPVQQADYTALDVGIYVVGAALILAGTFTSLIGYYLGRVQMAQASAQGGAAGGVVDEYEIPDSVVEKDIEYAMRKYRYSWGEGAEGPASLQINIKDDFEPGTVVGGKGVARTVQLDAPQVDDATKALRAVRPSKDTSVSSEWTEDTTKALLEFRKQKGTMVEQKRVASGRHLSWWRRMLQWLGIKRYDATPTELPTQKVGK